VNIENSITVIKTPVAALSLDELAVQIRTGISKCQAATANALAAAINTGDALLQAQSKVLAAGIPWQRWLRDNCFIADSTAKLYMRLARHRSEIEARINDGVALSLRAARRLIAKKPGHPPRHRGQRRNSRVEESLFDHWQRLDREQRQSALDEIGVEAILASMSSVFGRQLRDRVPARKAAADDVVAVKTPTIILPQLDRGAFMRGLGLAGRPGNKFPTMTMAPDGVDANGNQHFAFPRGNRSRH
jgi:hypothetical protein